MSVDHYENFPVASVLLPKPLRQAVTDIYRFARSADDIADEGNATPEERKANLAAYRSALHRLAGSHHAETNLVSPSLQSIFEPLAKTISRHQLPLSPFLDLLSAFEQDVEKTRYADFAALNDYCRRSANPVGRLMLHLYKQTDAQSFEQSDAICTALQLINFLQDIAIDWQKNRIYLPTDEMRRFGVNETHIAQGICDRNFETLIEFEIKRCQLLLKSGQALCKSLPGRMGLELSLIVHGGWRILEKLQKTRYDVFRHRPTLSKTDWSLVLWRGLLKRSL
jgi:squalene synthase HpnC